MAAAPDRPLRLLLLLSLVMAVGCAGCRVDQCSRQYMDLERLERPDADAMCDALREYSACVRATARSCRGNLKYHTATVVLARKIAEFNCSQAIRSVSTAPPTPASSLAPPPPPPECVFRGERTFRHCGLFGDPHLKTFFGDFQTCRVQGAWPLIDNPFLAVQVTNAPVRPDSLATATTKVTIVIRGRGSPCAREKTYQASSEGPLPATFIDGTRRSGPDDAVVLTAHDARRVEIHVRYIDATLVVRQAGRYLAFSARLPEEVARSPAEGAGLALCARGCPEAERLDPVRARGHAVPWADALVRCRSLNLTDHYLDWCVFDVMTAGDDEAADNFSTAAHLAQADVFRLDPASLKNRTTPSSESTSDASRSVARTLLTTALMVALSAWL